MSETVYLGCLVIFFLAVKIRLIRLKCMCTGFKIKTFLYHSYRAILEKTSFRINLILNFTTCFNQKNPSLAWKSTKLPLGVSRKLLYSRVHNLNCFCLYNCQDTIAFFAISITASLIFYIH